MVTHLAGIVEESRIDEFSRRRLIETHDIISELTARIHELENEINWMNDSRNVVDATSVCCGLSHVPNQPALFPHYRDPGGMLNGSLGMPSRNDRPPDTWNTHSFSGKRFSTSSGFFFITFSKKNQSLDFRHNGKNITTCNE